MTDFKSNDEITEQDIDQIHYYAISLYEEITSGGYDDLDKTRIKTELDICMKLWKNERIKNDF